jgi:anti-anti-sigma factor
VSSTDGVLCNCGHYLGIHDAQGCTAWETVDGRRARCPCTIAHKSEVLALDVGTATALVRVLGELDYLSSEQLSAALARVRDGGRRTVIVDFTQCRYIDSSVLTILIRASKSLGDALRIVVPESSKIRRMFAVTNLDRLLRIDVSLQNASS